MKIGGSIAVIAVGLVLSFAVKDSLSGVDLTMIGYILMGAGALALILSIAFNKPKGLNRQSEVRTLKDPASGETVQQTDVRDV